jgi:hypothetical protein
VIVRMLALDLVWLHDQPLPRHPHDCSLDRDRAAGGDVGERRPPSGMLRGASEGRPVSDYATSPPAGAELLVRCGTVTR